jgi:hypothetical protein
MASQGETRMRTVLIRIQGAKRRRIRKLQLREGARVSDILQALNVPAGYILARTAAPTTPFPSEAEVHSLVCDSDHLIARSRSAAVETTAAFTLTFSN